MRLLSLLALLVFSVAATADNWPAFRGAGPGSVPPSKTLPSTWDKSTNVKWSAAIPGRGWSSPIVWGDRVFVTSAVSDTKLAEARKGLYIQDLQGKAPAGEHKWQVHCLDAKSGKILWTKTAFEGEAKGTIHIKNSLASETPATDGKHVVASFGNVGTVCYDLEGKELWKQKATPYKTKMGWGTGGSPAIHDGKVIAVNDNEERSFIQALDAKDGKELWKIDRKEASNWGTPFVWKNDSRTEIVTAGTGRVRSYGLDGKLLWELRGMSSISIPTPFAAGDLLYVSSGYVLDSTKPVYAIRAGASGDISLEKGETSNKHIVWCQRQAGAYHPTPAVLGDHLYVLLDQGFLSCYEAKTGKEVYSRKRLGGRAYTASPVAYDGKVFCLNEDGETIVVQAGPEFKLLGRNALEEMALATPAIAGGSLFVRTESKLYCLRQEK